MLSRAVFTLALLSTAAMGVVIQNDGSDYWVTFGSGPSIRLHQRESTDFESSQDGEKRTFWKHDRGTDYYLYDIGAFVVDLNPGSGTSWNIKPSSWSPESAVQITSPEGLCWTQSEIGGKLSDEITLEPCDENSFHQYWKITESQVPGTGSLL